MRLFQQCDGVLQFRFGNALSGVCPVCDLVGIIADGGQFPQECSVGVRWSGTEILIHNEFAKIGVGVQTGDTALLLEVREFRIIQP